MRGASGDECGKLLGQEYNRPAEAGVLKKPREATLTFNFKVSLFHCPFFSGLFSVLQE
jgi:hypothetical protein